MSLIILSALTLFHFFTFRNSKLTHLLQDSLGKNRYLPFHKDQSVVTLSLKTCVNVQMMQEVTPRR